MCWTYYSAGHSNMTGKVIILIFIVVKTDVTIVNLFHKDHLEKPHQKQMKIKFFHNYSKLNIPTTTLTPSGSKTVRDRNNLLTEI